MGALVVVVGLPGAGRRGPLERALDAAGLPWRAVPGVDLRHAPGAALHALADQRAARVLLRRDLTGGEVGCALAHREGVRAALASGYEWGVVLEDDARPTAAFGATVRAVTARRTARPTVVLLHAAPRAVVHPLRRGDGVVHPLVGPADGAFGYALNRPAMAAYPLHGAVRGVADWPWAWSARVDFWRTDAPCVRTGDAASTLDVPRRAAWAVAHEPVPRRAARIAGAVTGLRYLRHRDVYGSWRDYVRGEVRVLAAHGWRRAATGWRRDAAA